MNEQNLSAKYDEIYRPTSDSDNRLHLVSVASGQWPRNRNEAIIHQAHAGGRLLEIGCGNGSVLNTLAPNYDEAIGIELSAERVAHAQRNLAHFSNCKVICGSVSDLSTKADAPFDCIVWADVIEHIPDVIETMHLLAQLSRPGTQLITVTPNIAYLLQRLKLLAGRSVCTSLPLHRNNGFLPDAQKTVLLDGGHLHYFTFRQVEMLYEIAGFRPQRRLGFGSRLSRLRDVWPTLLSGAVCISGAYQP